MRTLRVFQVAVAVAAVLTLVLGGAASSYGPAPAATWVVSGRLERRHGRGGRGLGIDGLRRRRLRLHRPRDRAASCRSTRRAAPLTSPWPVVGGTVNAVASDGSGGWFIGGSFASIGTRHADNVAHIKADGTLDTGFAASTDGPVYALAVSGNGSTLFAGGFFAHASDATSARSALAAPSTRRRAPWWRASTRASPARTSFVSALELSRLDALRGRPRSPRSAASRATTSARSTPAGRSTTWNPRPNDLVNTIAVGPAGHVYVGGFFSTVNGNTTRNLRGGVRPDRQRGTATPWYPDAPTTWSTRSRSRARRSTSAGTFAIVGGPDRGTSLAAVDATSGAAPAGARAIVGAVYQLAVSGSTVYAAGSFQNVNNVAQVWDNVAAFNTTTGATTAFSPIGRGRRLRARPSPARASSSAAPSAPPAW